MGESTYKLDSGTPMRMKDVLYVPEEGGLYKLKGHSDVALTHSTESPCELWHRRLAHINYKALPYVS
jgi:hypothetical protein